MFSHVSSYIVQICTVRWRWTLSATLSAKPKHVCSETQQNHSGMRSAFYKFIIRHYNKIHLTPYQMLAFHSSPSRSLKSSQRAHSVCGSCATRNVTTNQNSTRTTTRLWTRSWARVKYRQDRPKTTSDWFTPHLKLQSVNFFFFGG